MNLYLPPYEYIEPCFVLKANSMIRYTLLERSTATPAPVHIRSARGFINLKLAELQALIILLLYAV